MRMTDEELEQRIDDLLDSGEDDEQLRCLMVIQENRETMRRRTNPGY